ncbi:MAG TPA: AraC family transcriptional regulator [Terriglobales bacterium]|nr:AraC family transcriptional regulator [Terriglobales bacterium]
MSLPDKALWIIERNSTQPLTLDGIAAACGVARSHLAHAFGTATGVSVMQYVRARRLTVAARALAFGAPDILSVALDAGYGSHEAFTRAFRDRFGQTPEGVRERRSVNGLALVDPLELRPRANVRLDPPHITDGQSMRVVGLAERCSFETTVSIPAQWQRFMECYDAIPYKHDHIPIGVCYSADDDGQFLYMCGAEVHRFGERLPQLLHLEIPQRQYAVFEHAGHVSTIFETYRSIWNEAIPATGRAVADAPVIERHNPAFDPRTGEGGLTLWIPLAS